MKKDTNRLCAECTIFNECRAKVYESSKLAEVHNSNRWQTLTNEDKDVVERAIRLDAKNDSNRGCPFY